MIKLYPIPEKYATNPLWKIDIFFELDYDMPNVNFEGKEELQQ